MFCRRGWACPFARLTGLLGAIALLAEPLQPLHAQAQQSELLLQCCVLTLQGCRFQLCVCRLDVVLRGLCGLSHERPGHVQGASLWDLEAMVSNTRREPEIGCLTLIHPTGSGRFLNSHGTWLTLFPAQSLQQHIVFPHLLTVVQ